MKDRLVTIVLSVVSTYGLIRATSDQPKVVEVDRLIVRKKLIVSDTGQPWEKGFEAQQIPRGIYARALHDGPGGLWVRSRLIKGEIDDPFDNRTGEASLGQRSWRRCLCRRPRWQRDHRLVADRRITEGMGGPAGEMIEESGCLTPPDRCARMPVSRPGA
jgi:hypothetical protein